MISIIIIIVLVIIILFLIYQKYKDKESYKNIPRDCYCNCEKMIKPIIKTTYFRDTYVPDHIPFVN